MCDNIRYRDLAGNGTRKIATSGPRSSAAHSLAHSLLSPLMVVFDGDAVDTMVRIEIAARWSSRDAAVHVTHVRARKTWLTQAHTHTHTHTQMHRDRTTNVRLMRENGKKKIKCGLWHCGGGGWRSDGNYWRAPPRPPPTGVLRLTRAAFTGRRRPPTLAECVSTTVHDYVRRFRRHDRRRRKMSNACHLPVQPSNVANGVRK
jgi:hypothetical protein